MNMKHIYSPLSLLFFVLLCCIPLPMHAPKATSEKVTQVKLGNFALPGSQQPGPLFTLGQLLVDKHDLLGYAYFNTLKGENQRFTDAHLNLLYGMTDKCSVFID